MADSGEDGRWLSYLAFGFVCAVGALAKYNFLPVYLALLLAGMASSAFRERIFHPRMCLA